MANNPNDMFGLNNRRNNNNNSSHRFDSRNIREENLIDISRSVQNAQRQMQGFFDSTTKMLRDLQKINPIAPIINSYDDLNKQSRRYYDNEKEKARQAFEDNRRQIAKKYKEQFNNEERLREIQRKTNELRDRGYSDRTISLINSLDRRQEELKNNLNKQAKIREQMQNAVSEKQLEEFTKRLEKEASKETKIRNSIDQTESRVNTSRNKDFSDKNRAQSTKKYLTSTIHVFTDSIEKIISIWTDRIERGIDKIYQTYESTYTNVAVLMNQNQSEYMAWQTTARDDLRKLSLDNNIAISTIMEQLDAVVKLGLSGQDAQNKAMSDSISKTIAPFVDTTSEAYTDLQLKLGDKFVNTMNGMGENVRQQVGQLRIFSKGINEIITKLDPIMLNSKADYTDKYLGEVITGLEQIGADKLMTQEQLSQLAYDIAQGTTDWYSAINSDNLALRTAIINANDPTNISDVGTEFMKAAGQITQGINGVREQSTVLNVTGISSEFSQLTDIPAVIKSYEDGISKYEAESEKYGSQLVKDFDKYTTVTAQKDISTENNVLGISQFRQQYPDGYQILSDIYTGLIDILTELRGNIFEDILDKGFDKLLDKGFDHIGSGGSGGSGSSLRNILSTIGTYAAGAAPGAVMATGGLAATGAGIYYANDVAQRNATASDSERDALAAQGVGSGLAIAGGTTAAVAGGIGIAGGVSAAAAGATAAGAAAAGLAAIPVFGWVALGVAALGVGIAATANHFSKLNKGVNAVNEAYDRSLEKLNEEREIRTEQINLLKEEYNAGNTDKKEEILAKEQLFTPEELKNMTELAMDKEMEAYTEILEGMAGNGDVFYPTTAKASDGSTYKTSVKGTTGEIGKAVANKLESYSKNLIETEQSNIATTLAESLYGKSEDEALAILKNIGLGDTISKGLGKGTYSDKELAKMATTTKPEEFADLLREDQWANGSATDKLTADSINKIYKNLGIDKAITTETEMSDIAAQISDAATILYSGKYYTESSGYTLRGEALTKYREAREFLSQNNIQDMLVRAGMDSMYTTDFNTTFPKYAVGNPYVVEDQLAYIHQGEAVLTKAQNEEYRKVATSIPILNEILGNLFNKSSNQGDNNDDASRNDIISTMNSNFNRLIDLVSNLYNNTQNKNNVEETNGLAKPVVSSYNKNLVSLSPSM